MSNVKKAVKLSDLAEIRTGFTFREKVEEVESGNAHVLQIKDIRNIATDTYSYTLFADALPQIDWQGKDNAIVSPECVLLPCRGEYLKAHYFVGNQDQSKILPLIVSSQFLILMPNKKVMPEYLCSYLTLSYV
ncbi:MAG: restriction endonuclease subunit S, partial [Acinetobacter radioresistens]